MYGTEHETIAICQYHIVELMKGLQFWPKTIVTVSNFLSKIHLLLQICFSLATIDCMVVIQEKQLCIFFLSEGLK